MHWPPALDRFDRIVVGWMQRHGLLMLRLSIGIIFIWFGALKFFPDSEINQLLARTIYWVDPRLFIPMLGAWEIIIGFCMLARWLRVALLLLFLQMPGTLLPLFILPEVCFTHLPLAPTIAGQYIIKNLVLISAAIVVGGTARRQTTADVKL